MRDNVSPKEVMLKKIRNALLHKRENPFPIIEEHQLYHKHNEELEILFAQELNAVNGHFIFCENGIDFIENILNLAEQYQWRKIYCWEPLLQTLLNTYEFPFYETDKNFENAEVGITLCEALVARHGSVLVSSSGGAGRRLSTFPNQHIVVARTGQLVLDLNDAYQLIHQKYGEQIPSSITCITGPSCNTQIENIKINEGSGTKDLFVFMIDDFS